MKVRTFFLYSRFSRMLLMAIGGMIKNRSNCSILLNPVGSSPYRLNDVKRHSLSGIRKPRTGSKKMVNSKYSSVLLTGISAWRKLLNYNK